MPIDPKNIFMFPESYNELRKELYTHWPELWNDPRGGWAMAFDAELFVEFMNSKLDGVYKVRPATNNDELAIDYICKTFLTELRKRRGELNP
jgi:hypothetical protein